jgi:hypothetical protein
MKIEKEEIDDIYGRIISKATDGDFEKKNELKEYEEFCLLELKRAVEDFKFAMKPVYAHCQVAITQNSLAVLGRAEEISAARLSWVSLNPFPYVWRGIRSYTFHPAKYPGYAADYCVV